MGMINKAGMGSSSRTHKAILLLTFCVSVLMSGCKASPTWSAEARSPDGKMVATAETFANGGFVAPGPPATLVYLNWTAGSQPKTLILALSGGAEADDMKVGMNWLAPARLELTYKGTHRSVDFQAVKFAGVDITLRDFSGNTDAAR